MRIKLGYGDNPLTQRLSLMLRLFVLVIALSLFFGRNCLSRGGANVAPSSEAPPSFELAPEPR